jgi:hypothetical protein
MTRGKTQRSRCPKCKIFRDFMWETKCPFCNGEWKKPDKT